MSISESLQNLKLDFLVRKLMLAFIGTFKSFLCIEVIYKRGRNFDAGICAV